MEDYNRTLQIFHGPGRRLGNRGNNGNHGNSSCTRESQILPIKIKTSREANLIKFEKKNCKIKTFRDFQVFILSAIRKNENSEITEIHEKTQNILKYENVTSKTL